MNQKLEDQLQLALETSEEDRARTEDLNVGFDRETKRWELIVKYHGSLAGLEGLGVTVERLLAGYAILTVPEGLVERIAEIPEIEYVEKPKRFFYDAVGPTEDSCVIQVTGRDPFLTGEGVLVAVLDSGIDYRLPEFRNADGSTRIRYLWDQTLRPESGARSAENGMGENGAGVGGQEGIEVGGIGAGVGGQGETGGGGSGAGGGGQEGTGIGGIGAGVSGQEETGVGESGAGSAGTGGTEAGSVEEAETERRLPPAGFAQGVEFTEEQINRALAENDPYSQYRLLPTVDTSGHGTAVAGIAAGRSGSYQGVAPRADLLIVKLGLPSAVSFPRTTEIMRGLTYAVNKAVQMQMPLAVNLSFGNNYGAHDGSSLLERFLDNVAEVGRTVICVGSGNEAANGGHLAGSLAAGEGINDTSFGAGVTSGVGFGNSVGVAVSQGREWRTAVVELAVAEYERSLNVQLWKNYSDEYRIRLRSPGGSEAELSGRIEGGKYTLTLEETELLVFFGEPSPYSAAQEIYLEFLPFGGPYLNSGVWTFFLEPVRVVTGKYYFYLPSGTVRNASTVFFRSTPEATLTIPSTAARVVTVGAYTSVYNAYADFSGRGYGDTERTLGVVTSGMAKPDLVAPGVNVLAPDLYGGYMPVTGTSFATPVVTGSAALLMEWGIVRGNDPFLYGEKVKAYLRKGARPLRGDPDVPNDKTGWGSLCVAQSLPR